MLQSAPIEVSAEASPGQAESSSPDSSDSQEVVEEAASDRAEAPDPAGLDGESSKEHKEDDDEPQQVSDPRLNPKYVVVSDPSSDKHEETVLL